MINEREGCISKTKNILINVLNSHGLKNVCVCVCVRGGGWIAKQLGPTAKPTQSSVFGSVTIKRGIKMYKNMWTWPSIGHTNLKSLKDKTHPQPIINSQHFIPNLKPCNMNPKPDSKSNTSNPNIPFHSAWKRKKSKDKM